MRPVSLILIICVAGISSAAGALAVLGLSSREEAPQPPLLLTEPAIPLDSEIWATHDPEPPGLLPKPPTLFQSDALEELPPQVQLASSEPQLEVAAPTEQQEIAAAPKPEALTPPTDAAPIEAAAPGPATPLRQLLVKIMPDSEADQLDIWEEQFEGMPLEAVAQIFQIRENIDQPTNIIVADVPKRKLPPLPLDLEDGPVTPDDFQGDLSFSLESPSEEAELEPSDSALIFALNNCLHNIANAHTVGFKRATVQLSPLKSIPVRIPGAQDSSGKRTAVGIEVGLGVEVAGTVRDFTQGKFIKSTRPLDFAISGDGFFQVTDRTNTYYTRYGAFSIDADGELVLATAQGAFNLEPSITIPADATGIIISTSGNVEVQQAGVAQLTQVGQLQLARFINPGGLSAVGGNLYEETGASGGPMVGTCGLEGLGTIKQYLLEASNVDLQQELLTMRQLQEQIAALRQARGILRSAQGTGLDSRTN